MMLTVAEEEGNTRLLRFGEGHTFHFPRQTAINKELWNEYLAVFWSHPSNTHYYLRDGVTIAKGDIVFDCGACEGFFTRFALDLGASRVVCIEPSRIMVDCLRKTFAKEISEGTVLICEVALSSVAGRASFDQQPGEAFTGRLLESGLETVALTTLDSLAARTDVPNLIKMDLEGAEYEALRGGLSLLGRQHPKLAVTTYHCAWDHAAVGALIRSLGFPHMRTSAATMRHSEVPRPVMVHAWAS
jgi:FkbM family methyltransferase